MHAKRSSHVESLTDLEPSIGRRLESGIVDLGEFIGDVGRLEQRFPRHVELEPVILADRRQV